MATSKYFAVAILLFLQVVVKAKAFAFTNRGRQSTPLSSSSSLASTATSTVQTVQAVPPSWEELSTRLDELQQEDQSPSSSSSPSPLITLFRDTNGWCPFCERVWFALKIKNIPYDENLIGLYDKPKWFTDMVPTGLVPAVLIHTDTLKKQETGEGGKSKEDDDENEDGEEGKDNEGISPQRILIWESLDILKALDEYFPDTPKLVHEDNEEYMKGREVMNNASSAGYKYVYNMRNETLTMEEKDQQKVEFDQSLNDLDAFIGSSESPFFLDRISGLDVEAVPTLERWRYQLPITKSMDITDGRPNLKKWFEAMDGYEPYIERVGGDKYSWTAVASTFLKFFGAGKDGLSDETKEIMAKAEEASERMRHDFSVDPHDSGMYTDELLDRGRTEAAAKLISNHEAIVKDCTHKDPKSQQEIERADDPKNADWVIRLVAAKLLNVDCPSESTATTDDTDAETDLDLTDAAKAARTVASRLCVPRDVGGPAASVLRYELVKTASGLTQ